jgi:hypothetical protein
VNAPIPGPISLSVCGPHFHTNGYVSCVQLQLDENEKINIPLIKERLAPVVR